MHQLVGREAAGHNPRMDYRWLGQSRRDRDRSLTVPGGAHPHRSEGQAAIASAI